MTVLALTGSAADAKTARDIVAGTQAVVDQHLTHEESELAPLLRPHLKDIGVEGDRKQLRPRSVADTGNFLVWLHDGTTDKVQTYLRSTIPAPVTFQVSRLAGRT